jgi:hypothetical protein
MLPISYRLVTEYSWSLFVWQMLILSTIILWIYCLVNISKNKFKGNNKAFWILLIIFLPFVGSILYISLSKKIN